MPDKHDDNQLNDLEKLAKVPVAGALIELLQYEVYQPIDADEPVKLGRRNLALEILQGMGVLK